SPPVLKVYQNGNWEIQHLDVFKMDEDLQLNIETITETLGSITNDNKLSHSDRIVVANELNRLIGRIMSTKNLDNFINGLPDLDELDTLGLGMLANTRSSAVMLGIDDDEAYKNVEKEYNSLVTYLDSLKEVKGINIWDI